MSAQRITALFLMTAGFGWIAGNFVQPDRPLGTHLFTTFIHALPVALTILFAVPLMQRRDGDPGWARRGITALSAIYMLGIAAIIVFSVANPDPNAFGIHSLGDAEAAAVMTAGTLLWLASLVPVRARATAASRHTA